MSTTMWASSTLARDRDLALPARLRRHRQHRLGGVLDHVGQRLAHQAGVEAADQRLVRQVDREVDLGLGDADQEHRLADRLGQVAGHERRLRHAREGRELVHHAADVADLADDGVGALVEDLAVLVDGPAELALQPLGRQLDRGQRVLDLVGDAARHVGPGGRALGRDQIADVVEGDDVAVRSSSPRSVVTRTLIVRSRPSRLMVIWSRCSARRRAAPPRRPARGAA